MPLPPAMEELCYYPGKPDARPMTYARDQRSLEWGGSSTVFAHVRKKCLALLIWEPIVPDAAPVRQRAFKSQLVVLCLRKEGSSKPCWGPFAHSGYKHRKSLCKWKPFCSQENTRSSSESICPAPPSTEMLQVPGGRASLTSPFSKGTIREYSVVQMASSSLVTRSTVLGPNFSMQSLLDAVDALGREHCSKRKYVVKILQVKISGGAQAYTSPKNVIEKKLNPDQHVEN